MEAFWNNLVEAFQNPIELLGIIASSVGISLLFGLRGFVKKKGVGYIVKVAFHYAIDLVTKNTDALTKDQAEDKKKLVNGLLQTPEIKNFMQQLNDRAIDEIDRVQGRLNDLNAKMALDYVKENPEIYKAYQAERSRLTDKLAKLNEEIS